MGYRDTYDRWRNDPSGFWMEAANDVDWFSPPTVAFEPSAGVYGPWFPDATCNTCHNALDRHVEGGRADQAALVYDSPVTGTNGRSPMSSFFGRCRRSRWC